VTRGEFDYSSSFGRENPEITVAEVKELLAGAGLVCTWTFETPDGMTWRTLWEREGLAVHAEFYGHYAEWAFEWATNSHAKLTQWSGVFNTMVPEWFSPMEEDNDYVPVTFWMQNPMTGGVASTRRYLNIHHWDQIDENYPARTRAQVAKLMSMEDGPESGAGKLVLMHGPPGTGKTRSILSLIKSWSSWCEASVVTDSDRFFGDPTYLNDLVFGMEGYKDWLLLIIEDGDEFIDVDDRKGQGVSRLLNICDGLMGQGLNILTLLTTNTEMARLNPALARPGRCVANIEFPSFPAEEAAQWLATNGIEREVEGEMTLAEMYAVLRGDDEQTETIDGVAAEYEVEVDPEIDEADDLVEAVPEV
jgi:hypothetical protein